MSLLASARIAGIRCVSTRPAEHLLRCGPRREAIAHLVILRALPGVFRLALGGLGRRCIYILEIGLELECLMDLSHLIAPTTHTECIRVVHETVRHTTIRLSRLLALLRLFRGHVDAIVLHHAPRIRTASVLCRLRLLHIDVTSL